MDDQKLFMLLLGCKPSGRNTEQHDIFFSIGSSLSSLVPSIRQFWPEAGDTLHIDAYREVTQVDGYAIKVQRKEAGPEGARLFFINLGGYKANEFEEFHYKILSAGANKSEVIQWAKTTAFFKHNYSTHVDDKYGIDVDDIFEINEILPPELKSAYSISLTPGEPVAEDTIHLGYFQLHKL
jgi:hypothetical protein